MDSDISQDNTNFDFKQLYYQLLTKEVYISSEHEKWLKNALYDLSGAITHGSLHFKISKQLFYYSPEFKQ